MRRMAFCAMFAALGAIAVALPAAAQSTQGFNAQFHDSSPCPTSDFCGKGVVVGFGTVTTTLTVTSIVPGPGANCVTATADRVASLDTDGSTLLLAVTGTICDQKLAGTFTITGGTGTFAGATGGGTLTGVTTPTGDQVQYRGTISLP